MNLSLYSSDMGSNFVIFNDVPKKVTDYAKEINEFLMKVYLKLITNPKYFFSSHGRAKRHFVWPFPGTISDAEIAAGKQGVSRIT